MTKTKYANKLQELCVRAGIKNQFGLRRALQKYHIAESTARELWLKGAHQYNQHRVIEALAELLQTDSKNFLED